MGGSIYIGRPFGIRVYLHWSFLIFILFIFFSDALGGKSLDSSLQNVLFILAVFGCVTLHEFGHALAARRYGIQTQSITLLPIGGAAALERIPEKPWQEFVVSIAGPLVNVVIFLVLGILIPLFLPALSYSALTERVADVLSAPFLVQLAAVNLGLVIFNIIPAFPMDGGRIFRALLSLKLPRVKATRIASVVGQLIAVGFGVYGFWTHQYMLAAVGVFVYFSAQAEFQQVESQFLMSGYKVGDILMHEFTIFHPWQPLQDAVNTLLGTQQKGFLVIQDNNLKGVITSREILMGMQRGGPETRIQEVMVKEVPVLDADDPLEKARDLFRKGAPQILPVNRAGMLAGVIDAENVDEFLMLMSVRKSR